ncbi:MAG: DUF302 domain-containing protein [Gammaproteobacteria bacterium]|nr:DUF302 domain-containing protein [Gammaproteobacteria bacterium]NCF82649.1 DUF302 domain-containing protein [Pseudomonadota bacterium]
MVIDEDVVTKSYDVDDFDDLLNDLLSEIEVRNYRVTRINHIDNVLDQKERGLSTKMRFTHYKIVEFCNLNSCAEMLSADVLSGVFMPVRFIAYQGVDDQKAYVSFLRPTRFAALFSATGVMDVAVGLEKDMSDVLEELA